MTVDLQSFNQGKIARDIEIKCKNIFVEMNELKNSYNTNLQYLQQELEKVQDRCKHQVVDKAIDEDEASVCTICRKRI